MKRNSVLFIILAVLMMLFSSCDNFPERMPQGEDNINYLIFPYLRFELSDDGTYYSATVLEGAKLSYVSIPGECSTKDGVLPVRVFSGFENPLDSVELRTLVLATNVTVVADGALDNATKLETITSQTDSSTQTWAFLPDISKEGYHFLGWFAGDTQIHQGMPVDPDNAHAEPRFEEHQYISHEGKDPTCTEEGYMEYMSCSVCGHSTFEKIPSLGHQQVHVDATDPSCTEEGTREHYHCTRCGKDFSDESAINEIDSTAISPLGHSLMFHTRIEPSCTTLGMEAYYICSRCGNCYLDAEASQTVMISDLYIPMISHEADDGYHFNYTDHWHECTMCGTEIGKESHTIVQTIIENPTETQPGRIKQECQVCGWTRIQSLPIIGAEYTVIETTAPTCTEPGTIVYEYINEENNIHDILVQIAVNPLRHQGSEIEYKAPTCTEEGIMAHFHCNRCGKDFANSSSTEELDSVTIPMIAHEYSAVWQSNSNQHWHECLNCGAKTDITDHEHNQMTILSQYQKSKADCVNSSCYYYSCICGHKGEDTFQYGEPAGHSLIHVDKVDPVCADGGHIEYYECSSCHLKFSDSTGLQEITAIQADHEFSEGSYKKTSTGHTHICDVCHQPIGEEELHNSNKVVNDATYHWRCCSACGYRMTANEVHNWIYEDDGSRHCSYCGRTETDPQASGGFDVDVDNALPQGTLTLKNVEGTSWTFTLTDDCAAGSDKCRITSVTWFFDGEEVPGYSDEFEATFEAPHPRSYVVMCVFMSAGGSVGSRDYSLEGSTNSF